MFYFTFYLFLLSLFRFLRSDGGVLTYMVVGQNVGHVATRTLYSLRFASSILSCRFLPDTEVRTSILFVLL